MASYNFKKIDAKMTNKRKDDLLNFAKDSGFKYISEMLHTWHVKNKKSPAWISDTIFDGTEEVLFGKSGIYYFLTVQRWLIKGLAHKTKMVVFTPGICDLCKTRPKLEGNRWLCSICFSNADSESTQGMHNRTMNNW